MSSTIRTAPSEPDLSRLAPAGTTSRRTSHIFTVDVEDYFQVNAFEALVPRDRWDEYPTRVERNVEVLMTLLGEQGARATFFCLGWVADRYPELVRRIADEGHEVASHGWWHRRVPTMTPAEFREDVRSCKAALEAATGRPVYGFRAPSFSINQTTAWAFDLLLEEGYRYDSSVFPIRRPGYGDPTAPTTPYVVRRAVGRLLELPLATTTVAGFRVPAAGGGYLRHLPLTIMRRACRDHERRGAPAVFYIHPWEIDPDQPRLTVPLVTRWRHYGGLRRTLPRLRQFLSSARFTSVADRFAIGEDAPIDDSWLTAQLR